MQWIIEEKVPVDAFKHYAKSVVDFDSFTYWQMLGRFYTDALKMEVPNNLLLEISFIKQDEEYLKVLVEKINAQRSPVEINLYTSQYNQLKQQLYRDQIIVYRLTINYEIL